MFRRVSVRLLFTAILLICAAAVPKVAFAHCDTVDGPVVTAAKLAIERGEVTPVLMWLKPEHEPPVREALQRTLAVRKQSDAARELADTYFFETVVRLHRQGEGAPFNGLKAAGEGVDPLVLAADRALEQGSAQQLAQHLSQQVEAGLRQRFDRAEHARRDAGKNVEAGRAYVAAYVDLMHYLERLGAITGGQPSAHEHAEQH